MSSRNRPFEDSRIKQGNREHFIGLAKGNYPSSREKLITIMMPGEKGLAQADGVEQWILNRNSTNMIVCVERDPHIARQIVRQAAPWGKRVLVFRGDVLSLFANRRPFKCHLIFLDWMGSLDREEAETLNALMGGGWLHDRTILATTINASGQCRDINASTFGGGPHQHPQEQALRYQKYLYKLAHKHGWKISEKSYVDPYSCYDISRKTVPMLFGYLIGQKKARSTYNAYNDLY